MEALFDTIELRFLEMFCIKIDDAYARLLHFFLANVNQRTRRQPSAFCLLFLSAMHFLLHSYGSEMNYRLKAKLCIDQQLVVLGSIALGIDQIIDLQLGCIRGPKIVPEDHFVRIICIKRLLLEIDFFASCK